jgi:leucyl/phenylalanyl-tRNA--protein transferase
MLDWLMETLFPPKMDAHAVPLESDVWLRPEDADSFGLVGIGGVLSVSRLLSAYRRGIFPMYEEGEPICWWSPDPRAVIDIDGLHVSRRLNRLMRSGKFEVTFDQNFVGVMKGCANRDEGTWITNEMLESYHELHDSEYAHSVEVWRDGELAGGVYGVSIGGFFAGESMFSRERDASKVALVHLFERLRNRGFELFDTQLLNEHTERLGAYEISRSEYLQRLRCALSKECSFRS